MDGLPLALLANIGPWGLVAGFVLLIMTGRLVPRSTMQRERELQQQRTDDWKAAFTLGQETLKVQSAQLSEILTAVKAITPAVSPGGSP